MKTAVFTIGSKNYFSSAKTLMDSLKASNPSYDRYFAIADKPSNLISKICSFNHINLIRLEDLKIKNLNEMLFKYDILEFNTAIKPFVFLYLFKKYDRVIYFDPDIFVYENLSLLEEKFNDGYDIILTPHINQFMADDYLSVANEINFFHSGVYNLGFIGIQKNNNSLNICNWWAKRLSLYCFGERLDEGFFVDQKWMDFIPCLNDKTYVLRDNGCNVAYWNLLHRRPSSKNGAIYFNGDKLIFFHFSGFNPIKKDKISKYQYLLSFKDIGIAKRLFEEYSSKYYKNYLLTANDDKSYFYSNFSNGEPILDIYRYIYRDYFSPLLKNKDLFKSYEFFNNYEKIVPKIFDYIFKNYNDTRILCNTLRNFNLRKLIAEFNTKIFPKYKIDGNLKKVCICYLHNLLNSISEPYINRLSITKKTSKSGINLIGYATSEHGVGESCRMVANILKQSKFSFGVYDFEKGNWSRKKDYTLLNKITNNLNYNVSIINVNADQTSVVFNELLDKIDNSYKIAVWYWELPIFPDEWVNYANYYDEIWAPTKFIYNALLKKIKRKVRYIPLSINPINKNKLLCGRAYYKLPENCFLYLNMFDMSSFAERKNPEAVIKSFKNTFKFDDMNVGLVIKINNGEINNDFLDKLKELIGNYKNIYLLNHIYKKHEVLSLINVCDVVVSLHRSEGLGLLCLESMSLGKPVIATGWSGNMDFMNDSNSCLVDYQLVPVKKYSIENLKGQVWADANIESASKYMRKLYVDKKYYNEKSINAFEYISSNYNIKHSLSYMTKAIEDINNNFKVSTIYSIKIAKFQRFKRFCSRFSYKKIFKKVCIVVLPKGSRRRNFVKKIYYKIRKN